MAKADEEGTGRFHHCLECCSLLHCARSCLECSAVNDSFRSGTQVSDKRDNQDLGISCGWLTYDNLPQFLVVAKFSSVGNGTGWRPKESRESLTLAPPKELRGENPAGVCAIGALGFLSPVRRQLSFGPDQPRRSALRPGLPLPRAHVGSAEELEL
jgi:hypothetical protein